MHKYFDKNYESEKMKELLNNIWFLSFANFDVEKDFIIIVSFKVINVKEANTRIFNLKINTNKVLLIAETTAIIGFDIIEKIKNKVNQLVRVKSGR